MHKIRKYLKKIHKQEIRFLVSVPVVVAAMLGFLDLPMWSMAKEIGMQTPIVRQYRVAQETAAPILTPDSSAVPSTDSAVTPVVPETSRQPVQQAPVIEPVVPSPATTEPVPVLEPAPVPEPKPLPTIEPTPQPTPAEPAQTIPAPAPDQDRRILQQAPIKEEIIEEERVEIEFVDPREVKNALRDIKRMKTEIKSYIKKLGKLPNSADDITNCNTMLSRLDAHYAAINQPAEDESLRDALQEYYDGQYWDEVNKIRAKVEIPKELKNIARDLKKVRKLITQKAYQKLGLDLGAISAKLDNIQVAYDETQTKYAAGELEDAMDSLQEIHDCPPGEIMNMFYGVKEVKDQLKKIKNSEVKQIVEDLMGDVMDIIADGDYREASMALNEIRNGVMKLAAKFMKNSGGMNDEMRAKFDKFETLIKEKFGDKEENIEELEKNSERVPSNTIIP